MCTRKRNVSLVEIMCLSAFLSNNFIISSAQHSEGSLCTMQDGRVGTCALHYNCEFWINEMRQRQFPEGSDRCGFQDRDVIVCCPEQQSTDDSIILPDDVCEGCDLSASKTCIMETDGELGICTPIRNCDSRLQEIKEGKRLDTTAGRCYFDGYIEIVCCPIARPTTISTPPQSNVRPAVRACQEYENLVSGKNGKDIATNIIGGELAKPGDFPFMAALGYRKDPENPSNITYICGGSLITDRHVLTAAHCVSNINQFVPIEVRVGSVNINVEDEDTQRIPIRRIEVHPKYRNSKNYYDIAIITMSRPVTFRVNKTTPICLQTASYTNLAYNLEQKMIVSGWGVTDYNSDMTSNRLRYTRNLTLIDPSACAVHYKNSNRLSEGLDDSLLCVLDTNSQNRSDACQGDSGGPLLLRAKYVPTLVGIVSFGQSCASSVPSIYTSVFFHLDWIEQTVWPDETRSLD